MLSHLNIYLNIVYLSSVSSLMKLNKQTCVMFKVPTCEFHISVISSELLTYLHYFSYSVTYIYNYFIIILFFITMIKLILFLYSAFVQIKIFT